MGKVESGIFTGHLKWLGSFDECRQIQASVKTVQNDIIHPFKGQYCTIGIPVGDIIAGALGNLGALSCTHYLGVGFCIPDSCDKTELQTAINQVLPKIPLPGNKHLYAVYPHCQENNPKFDKKAIAAIATCSLFIAVMAIATLYDVIVIQRQKKTLKNTIEWHCAKWKRSGISVQTKIR
ncbi:hypothetical protein KUTeg_017972 [Tegillarca granosa]|uniref:Nose resistant-to-fluoxetine protein N-terminal domain-containing protein n=1 Tax=Tegillarca granosa TaxID=220873 RepID=A0ABQ9EGH6_TEGGR|nr:hypothetical protein KUTeg_017972 [Tegillarca granosa]